MDSDVVTTNLIGTGKRLGVLTSGGDAQGMNAAVRAVVRTALSHGAEVFAIYEGYQGMIDGGDGIRRLDWSDVGSILHLGGTVIGTFRSMDFRERAGRLRAARNLVERGIDRLVVIGGDGSLSGLNAFSAEWPELVSELAASGEITDDQAAAHPDLRFAGLVGSIDNDLVGTDMTIGADSALRRIVDAIDALASTAASHQRSFVVEVMGRHCGYLALMAAVAGGCDYVLVPENPPADGWEERMCAELARGREAGRRDSIVIVAEGATDRSGRPISADYVKQVIEERLHEDTRVTILGHVQRGGTPSAFDRWCSTLLGHEAALEVLGDHESDGPVIGFKGNRVARLPLMEAVRRTREVPAFIEAGDYDAAMAARGASFVEMFGIFGELAEPGRVHADATSKRVALIHAGGLAPGMNTIAKVAVRLGIARGHTMLGVQGGFTGLRDGHVVQLGWSDVEGWTGEAGARLGLRRDVPEVSDLYRISRALEDQQVDALIVAGGWNAYRAAQLLYSERDRYPAFRIPIVCVPASIDNNLPGSELAVGADTALQALVDVIDRVKMSAEAVNRCFVVETMGRYCGYLALMSGLAGGAERVYLHEDGITLARLNADTDWLARSFATGRKLALVVRNENANPLYTTDVVTRIFEQESCHRYDVRQTVVGHQQQGGAPSPFDRLLATRLASRALNRIDDEFASGGTEGYYLGIVESTLQARPMAHMMAEMDPTFRRPKKQWWLGLRPIVEAVSVRPEEREA
ncbi:MAG TPA: 6-phosphofructokinase [Propioniciclava tarda]|nr:6-phosphofructokinase [Propioniciclava tarda]SMO65668.1 6-phosphofructokinase [Propioniciclava tarda]HOA87783.1 6-phosphofructokinase [Propioniciclava tarda]HQA29840.1 6-phosphofructokinase [Propioniciclava tarda]HQD59743.1 6-phosphofructokinase [Propioniciclava tarda]